MVHTFFLFTFAVFVLVGCTVRRPVLPAIDGIRPADEQELKQFGDDWRAAQQTVNTARVLGTLSLDDRLGRTHKLRQVTIYRYPDRLRQQFFATNLNTPAVIVLVRGDLFEAFDFQNREGFRGPVTLENARRLLVVPLYPEEWMFWLSGRMISPPAADVLKQELLIDPSALRYVYQIESGDGRCFKGYLERALDRSARTVLRLTALEVRYCADQETFFVSAFEYQEGESFPAQVSFALSEHGLSGELVISQATVNQGFSAGELETLFSPPFPKGAPFRDIDALGSESVMGY